MLRPSRGRFPGFAARPAPSVSARSRSRSRTPSAPGFGPRGRAKGGGGAGRGGGGGCSSRFGFRGCRAFEHRLRAWRAPEDTCCTCSRAPARGGRNLSRRGKSPRSLVLSSALSSTPEVQRFPVAAAGGRLQARVSGHARRRGRGWAGAGRGAGVRGGFRGSFLQGCRSGRAAPASCPRSGFSSSPFPRRRRPASATASGTRRTPGPGTTNPGREARLSRSRSRGLSCREVWPGARGFPSPVSTHTGRATPLRQPGRCGQPATCPGPRTAHHRARAARRPRGSPGSGVGVRCST